VPACRQRDPARLAGMELSEWLALEAGALLPQTPEQLRAIAGALEMDYNRLAGFVRLCWSAWEPQSALPAGGTSP
jgi:hypothetical protein